MSIESKIPADEINIKHLEIEPPEVAGIYNFEKEYTEADWNELLAKISETLNSSSNTKWFSLAAQYQIAALLHPDRAQDFSWPAESGPGVEIIRILKALQNKAVAEIDVQRKIGAWENFVNFADDVKTLFPNKPEVLLASEENWQEVRDALEYESILLSTNASLTYGLLHDVISAWHVFPNQFKEWKKGLVEQHKDLISLQIRNLLNSLGAVSLDSRWRISAAESLVYLKVLLPKTYQELSSQGLPWEQFKKAIKYYRENHKALELAELSLSLKRLAAGDLQMTEIGLEPSESKMLPDKQSPLPETKKF